MLEPRLTRRQLLRGLGAVSALALTGCLDVDPNHRLWRVLTAFESWNRWLLDRQAGRLVKTFPPSAISQEFKINSLNLPPDYASGEANAWRNWRLTVDGLVERPGRFSFDELRHWPAAEQITRLDCVEGWSAIARWTGIRLSDLLARVGVRPGARYVVCHAADADDYGVPFYGSLDLAAALHPQTLLAYGFNGQVPLPLDHGAPLRLLLPTQLGYKSTKFLHRITVTPDLAAIGGGKGGYWEDQGYEWYAGL